MNYSPERERIERSRDRIDFVVGYLFIAMLLTICGIVFAVLPAMSTNQLADVGFRLLLAAVITVLVGLVLSRLMTRLSEHLQERFAPLKTPSA